VRWPRLGIQVERIQPGHPEQRMLSENGNPELRNLEALLDALGFRLSVELKAAGGRKSGIP